MSRLIPRQSRKAFVTQQHLRRRRGDIGVQALGEGARAGVGEVRDVDEGPLRQAVPPAVVKQDAAAALPAKLLGDLAGKRVADLCAAPGGKTTFIAQLMKNEGRIFAQDVSGERLKLVKENCVRLGVTCVETVLPATLNVSLPLPPNTVVAYVTPGLT